MYLNKKYSLFVFILILSFGIGTFTYAQTNINKDFNYGNNNSIYNLQGISIGTSTVNNNAITFSDGTIFDQSKAGAAWTTDATGIHYNSGNVGIGVTDPNSKLDVNGAIYGSIFYDKDNTSYYVNPSGTSILSGSIGIGTSPSAKLEVNRSNSTLGDAIKIRKASDSDQAWLSWAQGGEASGSWRMGYTGSPYDLTLNVGSASSLGTEIMKWGINGNINVSGRTINTGSFFDSRTAGTGFIHYDGTDANNAGYLSVYTGSSDNFHKLRLRSNGTGVTKHFGIVFDANSDSNVAFAVRKSGNVGIGDNSPEAKLDVAGTVHGRAFEDDTAGDWAIGTCGDTGGTNIEDLCFYEPEQSQPNIWGYIDDDVGLKMTGAPNVYASTFYDQDNTSYYVNPASNSVFSGSVRANGGFNVDGHSVISSNGQDFVAKTDGTRPRLVLDSSSSGDNWTSQGAYVSVGESGALGSASMHMTYRGDGYGWVGAGNVSNAVPQDSYFRFDYNSPNILTNSNIDMSNSNITDINKLSFNSGEAIYDGTNLRLDSNSGYIDFRPSDGTHGFIIRDFDGSSTAWSGIRTQDNGTMELRADGASYSQLQLFDSGTVAVGGGSGKLNVGTVDPLYTINGNKYATYMAGMIGIKEEITGVISLDKFTEENNLNSYKIDFTDLEEGSDLWLFAEAINMGNRAHITKDGKVYKTTPEELFNNFSVLLTSGFNGDVWYEKDPEDKSITIYTDLNDSEINGEVSYRFTAPRFDWKKWSNKADTDSEGLNLDKRLQ